MSSGVSSVNTRSQSQITIKDAFKSPENQSTWDMEKVGLSIEWLSIKIDETAKENRDNIKELAGTIDRLRKEVDNKLEDIVKKQTETEKSVDFCYKKLEDMNIETSNKIEDIKERMILAEKHDRKYNLLIYGVKFDKKEDITNVVHSFLIYQLGIDKEIVSSMLL
ncbi:hypothetical protein SNE40_006184 [Patella caerulea]|uniref:Uncharacterized protein n=1 Tax=Patella caerulea TaxID=87958 RepID=A0AAN8PX22_PATCE